MGKFYHNSESDETVMELQSVTQVIVTRQS